MGPVKSGIKDLVVIYPTSIDLKSLIKELEGYKSQLTRCFGQVVSL